MSRTDKENEIIEYVTMLSEWRKNAIATHEGRLVHFIPENNTYVYFRVHKEQTLMVAMNANEDAVSLERDRFAEILEEFELGVNVMSGNEINLSENIEIDGKTAVIWELE